MSGIVDAILKVQNAASKVQKAGWNPHTKSKFPNLESVLDVLNPLFQETGLAVTQYTVQVESGLVLRTDISFKEEVRGFDTPLLGIESASNKMQALGSAMTYARRYSLMAYFKLAPTDDDDAEAVAPKKSTQKTEAKKTPAMPANKPPPQGDMDPKAYVATFGKYKGMAIGKINASELADYVDYIEQSAKDQNKPLQGPVLDFLNSANQYIDEAIGKAPPQMDTEEKIPF